MTELEHFGVKGMHWGRRKARVPRSERLTKRQDADGNFLTRGDVKWAKKSVKESGGWTAYNKAARTVNEVHLPRINAKYDKVDLTKPGPKTDKYHKEISDALNSEFDKALKEVFGDSPSGKYEVRSEMNNPDANGMWSLQIKEPKKSVKHADGDTEPGLDVVIPLKVKLDKNGLVVSFEPPDLDQLEQLAHSFMRMTVSAFKHSTINEIDKRVDIGRDFIRYMTE